jgi:hypothetical protein
LNFVFHLALTLAVIFGIIVLHLRCRRSSLSHPLVGFRRYEPLPHEEDTSPFISRTNGHKPIKNSHAILTASEEDDDGDDTLFNKPLLA